MKITASKDTIRFFKFALVGVLNTLINWIIFFILNSVGIYYIIANIIAYTIATINSYFFNSMWVFKYKEKDRLKTSTKFVLLNVVGLILNTVILYIFVDIFLINKFIGLVLTTAIVMVINYIVNKLYVFKSNRVGGK